MKIDVVIFDLDDTLYPELSYVHSGFKAVADFLSLHVKHKKEDIFQTLIHNLEAKGRGKVFDDTIANYIKPTKKLTKKCLQVYRSHQPSIALYPEAISLLDELNKKNIPVYIVTDGNALVQEKKIKALGLKQFIKKALVTHRYGLSHAKPSSYCFEKITKIENTSPKNIVYIADNPHKDFIGIKPLGFQTIRLKQGMFKDTCKEQKFHAEFEITSLQELKQILKV